MVRSIKGVLILKKEINIGLLGTGTVGGGGLGDIAVRYGYYRWQTDIMIVTVVLLIVIFQIIQNLGTRLSGRLDHRKR